MNCRVKAMVSLLMLGGSGILRGQGTSGTELSGFVDVYYAYSWNQPPTRDRAFTTQPLRHNETNVNLAFLSLRHEDESFHARFALQTGTYVESNTSAEPSLLKNILEASVGSRLGQGVWIDAGIFPSHIGLEGIVSKDNWTYSRSLLADFSPYYETGVSITASLNDRVSLRALLLNGWQNINETNSSKAFGTQLQYRPENNVLFNWSTFAGNETPDSSLTRIRLFNDFGLQMSLSPSWGIAAVIDIGAQKKESGSGWDFWHGTSLMTRFMADSCWAATGRLEYYIDRKGVIAPTGTFNNFQVFSGSLNLDYAPTPAIVWRAEIRQYFSKDPLYPSRSGRKNAETCLVVSASAAF